MHKTSAKSREGQGENRLNSMPQKNEQIVFQVPSHYSRSVSRDSTQNCRLGNESITEKQNNFKLFETDVTFFS